MAILFVLLAVVALLALLTAPVPVKARVYLTLDGFRTHIRFKIAGIFPVHAKIVLKEGKFVLTVNGRPPRRRVRKPSPALGGVVAAVTALVRDGVFKGGRAAFYVGGEDSAQGALAVGLLTAFAAATGQAGRTEIFWNSENPVFVFDCGIKARISVMQTALALGEAFSERKESAPATAERNAD